MTSRNRITLSEGISWLAFGTYRTNYDMVCEDQERQKKLAEIPYRTPSNPEGITNIDNVPLLHSDYISDLYNKLVSDDDSWSEEEKEIVRNNTDFFQQAEAYYIKTNKENTALKMAKGILLEALRNGKVTAYGCHHDSVENITATRKTKIPPEDFLGHVTLTILSDSSTLDHGSDIDIIFKQVKLPPEKCIQTWCSIELDCNEFHRKWPEELGSLDATLSDKLGLIAQETAQRLNDHAFPSTKTECACTVANLISLIHQSSIGEMIRDPYRGVDEGFGEALIQVETEGFIQDLISKFAVSPVFYMRGVSTTSGEIEDIPADIRQRCYELVFSVDDENESSFWGWIKDVGRFKWQHIQFNKEQIEWLFKDFMADDGSIRSQNRDQVQELSIKISERLNSLPKKSGAPRKSYFPVILAYIHLNDKDQQLTAATLLDYLRDPSISGGHPPSERRCSDWIKEYRNQEFRDVFCDLTEIS